MTTEQTTEKTITSDPTTAPTTDNSTNVKHQQTTTATDPTTGNIIVTNAL